MADLINAFAELAQFQLEPRSVRLLTLTFCQRNHVVVLGRVDPNSMEPVSVGMLDPNDAALATRLQSALGRPITPVRLNIYEINKALQIGFSTRKSSHHIIDMDWELQSEVIPKEAPDHLDHLLAEAVARRASDIHIETYVEDVDVRFRLDGILHQVFTHINPTNVDEVVNCVKIMSGLDITERRRPQDGRFSVTFSENGAHRTVDFRVSVVPSIVGEDVVMRILDSDMGLVSIDMLGMLPEYQGLLHRLLANPEGMILVTGPTGSGKTTTLYAALGHISDGRRKIITAEDPIEYYVPKINQKQLTAQMGLHDLLRAMLRQDPDVLLVGEIRDRETGDVAMMASATGHVVLGTLHTSDAIGSVMRLRGLGLEDRDMAGTLLAVISQRLVRTLCPLCTRAGAAEPEESELFGALLNDVTVFEAVGCKQCYNTGYRGRVGLFEMFLVSEALQELIAAGATKGALRRQAREEGFRTLIEDGLAKVHAGVTTLSELIRVVPLRDILTVRDEMQRGQPSLAAQT